MRKVLLVLLVVVGVIFGYHKYQERVAMQVVENSVRDTSARVGAMLGYMRGGKGVTYADFLKRADDDLKAISDSQVAIKVGAIKASPVVMQSAVDYLSKSEIVLREAKNVTQKLVTLKVAISRLQDARRDLETFVANPTNDAARYRARSTDAEGLADSAATANAEFDQAVVAFTERLRELSVSATYPAKGIDKGAYLTPSDFQKITLAVK